MRLFRDSRGATAVEFALVAPLFLMFLFLLLEGGRMIFLKQAMNEIAFSSARCSALKLAACADVTKTKSYAVARATHAQLTLAPGNVAVASATCSGIAGAQVTITRPWASTAGKLFTSRPTTLTASSCFPTA